MRLRPGEISGARASGRAAISTIGRATVLARAISAALGFATAAIAVASATMMAKGFASRDLRKRKVATAAGLRASHIR